MSYTLVSCCVWFPDFLVTDQGSLPEMNSSQSPPSPQPQPGTQPDIPPIDGAPNTTAGMAADVALQQLPPPFLKRWFPAAYSALVGRQFTLCYSYEMPLGTNAPLRAVQGFNVTMDPDTKKKKPGLIAWKAGGSVRDGDGAKKDKMLSHMIGVLREAVRHSPIVL